eukprot:7732-Amphidinium_carterae.1
MEACCYAWRFPQKCALSCTGGVLCSEWAPKSESATHTTGIFREIMPLDDLVALLKATPMQASTNDCFNDLCEQIRHWSCRFPAVAFEALCDQRTVTTLSDWQNYARSWNRQCERHHFHQFQKC